MNLNNDNVKMCASLTFLCHGFVLFQQLKPEKRRWGKLGFSQQSFIEENKHGCGPEHANKYVANHAKIGLIFACFKGK